MSSSILSRQIPSRDAPRVEVVPRDVDRESRPANGGIEGFDVEPEE